MVHERSRSEEQNLEPRLGREAESLTEWMWIFIKNKQTKQPNNKKTPPNPTTK